MRTLFRNGPIYPMNGPGHPHGALLVEDRKIAYVGPEDRLDPDRVRGALDVDLAGRPLLPGLCDSHVHLVLAAQEFTAIDLRDCRDPEDIQRRLRERADRVPDGSWIVGHGWERHLVLADHRPSRALLDTATTAHPLLLTSKDLHSAWFNSAGFVQVESLTHLPDKCVIHRIDGTPSGLIFEDIFRLRRLLLPPATADERLRSLAPYMRHLWSCGITAVHSNESVEDLQVVRRALERSTDRVRVLQNLVFDSPGELLAGAEAFGESLPAWLCTGGAKLFLDGSFGTLTAAVSNAYDGTDDHGLLTMDRSDLDDWLAAAAEVGVPAVMHAIGDHAVELALEGLSRHTWPSGTQHRLEHAQLLSDRILDRYSLEGMVISSQPSHMWSDREIAERHLTDRNGRTWAYAHQTVQRRGGLLVFGSDAPVETVDPWKGIQAAVTRLEAEDQPPWIGGERITVRDALAAHTSRPARLHAHGFRTGLLEPGALADLVVLNRDPFTLKRSDLSTLWGGMKVDQTWLDGELVFERQTDETSG